MPFATALYFLPMGVIHGVDNGHGSDCAWTHQ